MSTNNTNTSLPTDRELLAFLSGDPVVRQELPKRLNNYLLKRARRMSPTLACQGLAEDIVQRLWQILLRKNPIRFDPDRGSARTYFDYILRTAITDVRSSYTPPGHRTRPLRKVEGEIVEQPPVLSLDTPIEEYDIDGILTLGDLVPDPGDEMEAAEAEMHANWLLSFAQKTAPASVSTALEVIYWKNVTLTEAARIVHLHRTTLRRRINHWINEYRDVLIA